MYICVYIYIFFFKDVTSVLCSTGRYCSKDSDIILNQVPPCIVHVVTAVYIKFDEHFDD